jgi:hypothetical protein
MYENPNNKFINSCPTAAMVAAMELFNKKGGRI